MQDIADRVGVSKALVSMVFRVSTVFRNVEGPSASTRERVMEVAAELDYRPNRGVSQDPRSTRNDPWQRWWTDWMDDAPIASR